MTRRKVRERRAQVLGVVKEHKGEPVTRRDISAEFHIPHLRGDLDALAAAGKLKVDHHRLPWRPDEYRPVVKKQPWWKGRGES